MVKGVHIMEGTCSRLYVRNEQKCHRHVDVCVYVHENVFLYVYVHVYVYVNVYVYVYVPWS